MIGSLAFHGIGFAFVFVTSYIYVDRVAPRDIRASAQSLLTLVTLYDISDTAAKAGYPNATGPWQNLGTGGWLICIALFSAGKTTSELWSLSSGGQK